MNDTIFNIIKDLLPPIITGAITYLITKYAAGWRKPIDKIEIAYDRVYYPIFEFMKKAGSEKKYCDIVDFCNDKILEHKKYFSQRTIVLVKNFERSNENTKEENYDLLYNNIRDWNVSCRKILGYPEEEFGNYRYLTNISKMILALMVGCSCVYISVIWEIFMPPIFKIVSLFLMVIGAMVLFCDLLLFFTYLFVKIVWPKIKRVIQKMKQ